MNYIFFENVRICCIYPAMSKITAKLYKNSRNKHRSNHFHCVLCEVRAYYCRILLSFNMNQVPEKAISWSVTAYNKILFSQCNLTSQLEPVQDKHL